MSEKTKTYRIKAPHYGKGVYHKAGSELTFPADHVPSKTWTLIKIDGKPCEPDGKPAKSAEEAPPEATEPNTLSQMHPPKTDGKHYGKGPDKRASNKDI